MTNRETAGSMALSLARQVGLPVLGTLAAAALLAGLPWEQDAAPSASLPGAAVRTLPRLTSGGKFAERVEGSFDPEPIVTLTTLPAVLPLFTAAVVPRLGLDRGAATAGLEIGDVTRRTGSVVATRAASRREPKRITAAPASPVSPHPDRTISMAALPSMAPSVAADRSLWSRSQGLYQQVASWGDTLLDRLLP